MATPNTPPENGANAPPQTGGRISNYVRRHTKGVIVSVIMGLGVLAIAGGGLGGYGTWVKSKSPEAGAAVASTTGAAEVAARLLVGGPGSGTAPESSGPAGRISITSSTATSDSITVNWRAPDGNNITAYHVEWRLQSEDDNAYRKGDQLPGTARSHTITGLTPGTGYRIFVGYVADGIYWRTGVWHDASTGNKASVELKITDNDFVYGLVDGKEQPVYVNDAWWIQESRGQGGWFEIKAVMSEAPNSDVDFRLEVAGYGNHPAASDDYETAPASGATFTVSAGQTESAVQKITFRPRCDNAKEEDEKVAMRFVNDDLGISSSRLGILIEDACYPAPAVRFMESAYSGSEGGRVTVTLTTDQTSQNSFTVPVVVNGGTADPDDDIDDRTWNVTFPAEVGMVSFYVDVTDDSVQEPAETVILGLERGDGYRIGSPNETTVTIAADPAASGEIRFDKTMYTVTEGVDSSIVVTVKRVDDSSHAIDFIVTATDAAIDRYAKASDGTFDGVKRKTAKATDGEDYRGGTFEGTIAAGEATADILISLIDDGIAEKQENAHADLSLPAGSNDRLADSGLGALINILDNDVVTLTLKEDFLELGEPGWQGRNGTLTPEFSIAFTEPISITCAADDVDFSPATLEVEPRQWNNPPTITVKAKKDGDFEYEKDEVDCDLSHSPVMVKDQMHDVPVFIADSDIANLPTTAGSERQRSYMITGSMALAGTDQYPAIVVDQQSAQDGPHTFGINAYAVSVTNANRHACERMDEALPDFVTVPKGAQSYSFTAKTPSDGHGAVCGITVNPPDNTWTEVGAGASGRHVYAVPAWHQR